MIMMMEADNPGPVFLNPEYIRVMLPLPILDRGLDTTDDGPNSGGKKTNWDFYFYSFKTGTEEEED